ncbi:xanthine dehydrogenase family protein molybdopterin-binding subunit [Mucilaginibacter ginsenosidivorans]|uniref:Xanthine dehydrogenase family protein molybdopterin-binding subunit n=1 Tax=Mucilaginibacter ginsenosidivorans TaxID=398053 RepID=A0A5B8UT75_9SPHI|nr:molybdopterin cofactor-binding domain-containing protein [Mucilaginibacter ginsenosidivorans]QEC62098.1 xanthine dehydrogenase family protein molybdopterin-binding subunit [Mucilaginibacter ginsenosidivorans]
METNAISRRNFLRASSLAGTALCLGFYFPADAKKEEIMTAAGAEKTGVEMNAWIHIDTDGKVTLTDHRAEMGQGSYQSVPQIIAEELEVDLNDVNIIFAQGDREKYGNQVTGGSSTIRGSYKKLLKLSASAREMLITAAAGKWNAPASECYAENGRVIHKPSGKKFHYGELVEAASKLEAPKDVVLKKRSDYKLIGKPLHRQDTPLKTNGEAIFGLDKKLPGMLYAVVERNPRLRGKLKSFDASAALKVPGVKKVFKIQTGVFQTFRDGVAVVADSTWSAIQGRKALNIEWDDSGFDHVSTAGIYQQQNDILKNQEGLSARKQGDSDGVLAAAPKKLDVTYETPYQSHSAMEPLNCVAFYQPDKLEIWGPIQAPEWVQDYISTQFKLPKEKVVVNMTFLGGGFGRKAFMDYPHEACLISKEMSAPVQVVWTREDDMTQGPYRAGISYRCQGAITDGQLSALKFKAAGQNIGHWMGAPKTQPNRSISEGFLAPYYKSIANISFWDVPFEIPIPNVWWRSVYASTNGFAYESFLNELAAAAGKDQLDFRREYLKDERCQKLIDKMEEVSGWKARQKNAGYGTAITECFGTTVGQVVKVSGGSGKKLKIDQVWAVMDCGWYVNPDIVKAQVEGAIVMALGAATNHEITFKDGLVEQRNFYNYIMPRMNDVPPVEVHIMENDADAGGVGEPGLPPFAPALTDAIFDLTGKRIRKLPFSLDMI